MRKGWIIAAQILCAACSDSSGPQPATPASLTFNNPPAAIVPGEQVTLDVTAHTSAGTTIASPTIEWSSSNHSIATVSAAGVLNGVAVGSATITARTGTVAKTHQVAVVEGGMITAAGGTISAFNGTMQLVVPAGAVTSTKTVRLRTLEQEPSDPITLRTSGVHIDFAGDLSAPARLTLKYDPVESPIGLPESRLGIARVANDAWQSVAGATVDAALNFATANITTSGSYVVAMQPSATACTAAEFRQFDFRVGNFAWVGPGTLRGEAENVPEASGCSIREVLRMTNGGTVRAVAFYEPGAAKWFYTSIEGAALTRLSGGIESGRMVMYNESRSRRVVFEVTGIDAHKQIGEATTDGTAWTRLGEGTYTKQAVANNIITPSGSVMSLADGAVRLNAPAGAVAQNVRVDVSIVPFAGVPDPSLVQGTVYVLTFTPAVTFAAPVALTVRYNPERAPIGMQEKDLGVAISEGLTWRATGSATVDTLNDVVTSNITQAGSYAVHRPSPAGNCDAPEHRQFDFWLGEWNVDGVHSSITRDPVGCTIYELYRSQQTGRSISFYDPVSRQWHQTYLFGQNNPPLRMSGGMEGNRMVMYVRDAGGELRQRWSWFVNADGTVTQRNEGTQDNGATWNVGFNGIYRRR